MKNSEAPAEIIHSFGQAVEKVLNSESIIAGACKQNNWFSPDFVKKALISMRPWFEIKSIENFLSKYPFISRKPKTTGLIMAGNIPAAGAHDLLMALLSGDSLKVKTSSRDQILIEALVENLPGSLRKKIEFVAELKENEIERLIASGSDNSSRYFEYYFAKTPRLIRKNRWSLGIVKGNESDDDLRKFAEDALLYCGLGCRSLSFLALTCREEGRNSMLERIVSAFDLFPDENLPAAWFEALKWQKAIAEMEGGNFRISKNIVFKFSEKFSSGECGVIPVIFSDEAFVRNQITQRKNEIQCVIGKGEMVFPGTAQVPGIGDFADGADTLAWLLSLSKHGC